MASESDRLLIQQIRQGDSRAWEHLIARYEGRLLAFVQRRLRDRASSEDVVQETFIGFLTSLPNFDESRELQTYLFTIASYKLTDQLRKSGRHPMQHVSDGAGTGSSHLLNQKIDSHKAASSVARNQERKGLEEGAISRSLTHLLDQWREQGEFVRIKVLELLFVKGWANRDAAAFLKITEQQVANIRFAAVKKMTEHVKSAGLPADVFPELKEEA